MLLIDIYLVVNHVRLHFVALVICLVLFRPLEIFQYSGQRIRDGSGRNTPEHGSSIPAGKFLNFFRCILITFLCFSARNWSEIFRPEYCFHVPMTSDVFLQDPAFFPSLSCRFLRDLVTGIFDLGIRIFK